MSRFIRSPFPREGEKRSPEVLACLDELVTVLRKYGFTLGHEDEHGCFIIARRSDKEDDWWLLEADEEV